MVSINYIILDAGKLAGVILQAGRDYTFQAQPTGVEEHTKVYFEFFDRVSGEILAKGWGMTGTSPPDAGFGQLITMPLDKNIEIGVRMTSPYSINGQSKYITVVDKNFQPVAQPTFKGGVTKESEVLHEKYVIEIRTSQAVATRLSEFTSRVEGLRAFGWVANSVTQVENDAIQLEIEKVGSIPWPIVLLILKGLFFVVIGYITTITITRVSDNKTKVETGEQNLEESYLEARIKNFISQEEFEGRQKGSKDKNEFSFSNLAIIALIALIISKVD